MVATHEHDAQREVLVPVGRGDDEVVELDVHQPLFFEVTFLLAGFLQTSQFLQCQWIREHNVPVTAIPWPRAAPAAEVVGRSLPIRLSNRCMKPVVSDGWALETAVGAIVP